MISIAASHTSTPVALYSAYIDYYLTLYNSSAITWEPIHNTRHSPDRPPRQFDHFLLLIIITPSCCGIIFASGQKKEKKESKQNKLRVGSACPPLRHYVMQPKSPSPIGNSQYGFSIQYGLF